jgi:polygalacturonase
VKISPLALATLLAGAAVLAPAAPAHAATFNVRNYGATGNGTTIDSPAIDRAITAANAAGGGIVEFPAGTYHSRSIHLKSNVTLQLNAGATIKAASSGIDNPEPNPYQQYQDFGHSHFRNALIWGENVTNVAITGTGTIDGDALERGDSMPNGKGDKALSLKMCSNVTIRDVTFRRGGHFAILMNGCHDVAVNNLKILTKEDRDGFNIINSWNVEVTNSNIQSSDDAIGIKSDFAMGRTFESHNIRIRNSTIHSEENNALQFGSETCGNFRDIAFENLNVTGAGKAGIGIVSMDGATISDIRYDNIRLTKTASAIFMKIGSRGRCPGKPPAGKIRDISISNVTGSNLTTPADVAGDDEYTPTIAGAVGAPIENIRLTNVKLTLPGGHPASDVNRVPPENNGAYPPRIYGVRPSYGWWLRHVRGVAFVNSEVQFDRNDGRPAIIVDDGMAIALDGVKVERGSSSAYDVGFKSVRGYAIENSSTTTGAPLRVSASNSTPLPGGDPRRRG